MQKSYSNYRFAVLFGVLLLSGCGSGKTLGTVTGTVTYKNQPLEEGIIIFNPEEGRAARGKIVKGNIVEVTTMELNDGVTVGKSKVMIQAVTNRDDMYKEQKSLIPEKYGSPKSNLTADIVSGSNTLKFDLTD